MKITQRELIKMRACADGLKRFIKQTNDTNDSVEVISLIGGENTYADLLWLAGKKFPKERIVRFACDCALLNIERIKPYTDKYDLIVEFLRNPTAHTGARAATHAAHAAAVRAATAAAAARVDCAAANAATYAAIARTGAARTAAIHAVIAAADAAYAAAYAADAAAYAAAYAAYVTSITISTATAAAARTARAAIATAAVRAVRAAARDGNRNKVDELLRGLFA